MIGRGVSGKVLSGVQLYEIRDKKTGMVFVLAPSVEHLDNRGERSCSGAKTISNSTAV
jgi:hypothetical protein